MRTILTCIILLALFALTALYGANRAVPDPGQQHQAQQVAK